MILGLPNDELKLLVAKVAVRMSGLNVAESMVGTGASAIGSKGACAAVGAPVGIGEGMQVQDGQAGMNDGADVNDMQRIEKMGGGVERDDMKVQKDKTQEMGYKLEKKIKEKQMDAAMYRAEQQFLQDHLESMMPIKSFDMQALELAGVDHFAEATARAKNLLLVRVHTPEISHVLKHTHTPITHTTARAINLLQVCAQAQKQSRMLSSTHIHESRTQPPGRLTVHVLCYYMSALLNASKLCDVHMRRPEEDQC